MSIGRDDRYVTDAQGCALSGAQVFYATQPASTSAIPPSPLATIYSNITGSPLTNPVVTDGFGHSFAYLDDSQLYTIVVNHPMFGVSPIVLPDQAIPATGGGGALTPFAGIPIGTINGTNRVFTLSNGGVALSSSPIAGTVSAWLNTVLINGLGYTISGTTITYAIAPQPAGGGSPADAIYAQGFVI